MCDLPPHTNDTNMATSLCEPTSGQSDAHSDKETTSAVDIASSSPNSEPSEPGSDQKATNDTPTTEGDADSTNVEEASDVIDGGVQLGIESEEKKKKKKKRPKKKGAAARKNVTGFEGWFYAWSCRAKSRLTFGLEFYADTPITPAEAAKEKKEIYNASRSFSDRIEECIQRYRASRRMDSERLMLFNKYLWLGGIDSSPRQFTGFAEDRDALAEADADEIRQMTATDFIGGSGTRFYDPLEPEHWFVDFEGIVKCFLSRIVPTIYMYDEAANLQAASIIKNFLNYVLMHDVCPEYTFDIMAARRICDAGPYELRMVHELILSLPGAFNTAAHSLFCDRQVDKYDVPDHYDKLIAFRVTVFSSALDQKIKKRLIDSDPTTIRVVNTKEETYEVVDIILPRQRDIVMVKEQLEEAGHSGKGKPAGILVLKPSVIDFGFNNLPRPDQVDFSSAESEDYLLEDDLLDKFDKGMKIKAIVCELNIGVRFIKAVKDVLVSFDLFLPQILMENWKDPAPSTRPPPSASNPNAEEKAVVDDDY
ncbi:Argonaute siRNA chaperone complex subunit Arb1-domain-containing protein [Daldinia vernicosa]|uniref:Argonaute siRNA chaperone complex subunit Arb1-domain-containing protein n=1 Tax=Daldinia vernicosa TaxID=114800 RepID=UPI00200811AB|nr:Argonaute siRNA chaperone complex subunit Arb1-domain-containing protein [Daldinia vernicosa]KAI0847519.1 Argonaute siRNA chaperone complex subunit Arb1-domain-containing protein [Daldinia vernicosa]